MDGEKSAADTLNLRVKHASDIIGNWGPFQRRLLTFFIITYTIAPFQNVGIVFYGPKLKYWCKNPMGSENDTLELKCASNCTEWGYDLSFFRSTIVDEWDLVCDKAWMVSASQSCYQLGYAISAVGVGLISDRYGRYFAYKWSILLEIVAGFSQALSVNIYMFMISRLFLGITAYGRFLSGFVLVLECVGPQIRAKMSVYAEFGWCIGYLLLPLVCYFIPHFRHVQLLVTGLEVISLYWLFKVPESPRWLLTNGRFEEAREMITKAAQEKGKISESEIHSKLMLLKEYLDEEEENRKDERKQTLLDMFKVPRLLFYCIILYFVWFAISFVSYGLSLNAGDLGGNLFITVGAYGIASLVSKIMLVFIVDKFDRKTLMITCQVVGGLCFFAMVPLFSSDSLVVFRVILAFIGKFFSGTSFAIVYLFTAETFPTTLRHLGVGSSSVAARVGSILAPFLKELAVLTTNWFPMLIFGTLSVMTGALFFLLPETRGKDIPDTIREKESELVSLYFGFSVIGVSSSALTIVVNAFVRRDNRRVQNIAVD